jgi:hypothetical protein
MSSKGACLRNPLVCVSPLFISHRGHHYQIKACSSRGECFSFVTVSGEKPPSDPPGLENGFQIAKRLLGLIPCTALHRAGPR